MRKIIFYIAIVIFLYLIFIIANIFIYHIKKLNNYGNGFLVGNIILLIVFGVLIYKTNPFKKSDKDSF